MDADKDGVERHRSDYPAELYYVIHIAFIEIRAAADLEHAKVLADIFHNIPMMMRNNRPFETLMDELRLRAERSGYEGRIAGWFRSAKKNLGEQS